MTKNGVTIRDIIASDRAGWEHLWQQYLHFYRADVSAEITEKTFIRLCQNRIWSAWSPLTIEADPRLYAFGLSRLDVER